MAVTWKKLAYDEPKHNTQSLSSGTFANASPSQIETIVITSGVGAVNFTDITGAANGQIKILIFGDSNITVKHDVSKFKLVGAEDLPASSGDVLELLRTGGIWIEKSRTLF